MKKTIKLTTGHTVTVTRTGGRVPAADLENADGYNMFYVVKIEGTDRTVMYLGRGYATAKREIVAWYPNSKRMWYSYGLTLESAIEGAIKEAWLFA